MLDILLILTALILSVILIIDIKNAIAGMPDFRIVKIVLLAATLFSLIMLRHIEGEKALLDLEKSNISIKVGAVDVTYDTSPYDLRLAISSDSKLSASQSLAYSFAINQGENPFDRQLDEKNAEIDMAIEKLTPKTNAYMFIAGMAGLLFLISCFRNRNNE